MVEEHPNVQLLKQLDLLNLAAAVDLFAQDFVWHFFNPKLPDIQGDYFGLEGLQTFFEKIGAMSGGTFKVQPISATAIGDELVVVHAQDRFTKQGQLIALDVVVVWRFVNSRIVEAWDIPSVYTTASSEGTDHA